MRRFKSEGQSEFVLSSHDAVQNQLRVARHHLEADRCWLSEDAFAVH